MKTVFCESRIGDEALINPGDFTKPMEGFPEICISTFSKEIIDKFVAFEEVTVIGELYTANGVNPIYKILYGGQEFAFYLSLVGAPACACGLEEVIALGARKFIFFGSCGVLDDEKVKGRIIVPEEAVRDEGTSYHYAEPDEVLELDKNVSELLKKTLERCGYPYVTGKIWTMDAIYRETLPAVRQFRDHGCVAVDMEYSALLAVAKYRNVQFMQFFYGADSLDNDVWELRDLNDHGLSNAEKYLALALECGIGYSEM